MSRNDFTSTIIVNKTPAETFNTIQNFRGWWSEDIEGKQTKITFTHQALVPDNECYHVCHDAWTGFIQKSLKSLIDKGKGEPNPKDGTNSINAENLKKWKIS